MSTTEHVNAYQWATASRLRKTAGHEIQLWHSSGQIEQIVREILTLTE
jgi:hypothetical protein